MKLLCRLGLHKWKTVPDITLYDMCPSPFDSNYSAPQRECRHCGKTQTWLPGYGSGSEIGCWGPSLPSRGTRPAVQ